MGLIDRGVGTEYRGLAARGSGAGRVHVGQRRDAALGLFEDLFQTRQLGFGLARRGLGLCALRLGRGQGGTGVLHLVFEFGRVQLDEHLTAFDTVVHVHANGLHRARQLTAHVDVAHRLQGAVGADTQGDIPTRQGLSDVLRLGRLLAAHPEPPGRRQQQQHSSGDPCAPAPRGGGGCVGQQLLQSIGVGRHGVPCLSSEIGILQYDRLAG